MGLISSAPYLMTIDAASLARIARLINVAPIFAKYYTSAMNASVAKVILESKAAAGDGRFRNPLGHLQGDITGFVQSPWRGVVGNTQAIPYAHRRDRGFVGKDSLDRFYNDPPYHYLEDGLQRSQAFISTAFTAATELAIRDVII